MCVSRYVGSCSSMVCSRCTCVCSSAGFRFAVACDVVFCTSSGTVLFEFGDGVSWLGLFDGCGDGVCAVASLVLSACFIVGMVVVVVVLLCAVSCACARVTVLVWVWAWWVLVACAISWVLRWVCSSWWWIFVCNSFLLSSSYLLVFIVLIVGGSVVVVVVVVSSSSDVMLFLLLVLLFELRIVR